MGTSAIVLAVNGERVVVPETFSPSHRLIDVLRSETRFTVCVERVHSQLYWICAASAI
jgi:hypothetical protein